MKKNELLEGIFNALIKNGKISEKADIFGEEPMEDKVFTKKLKIGKNIGSIKIMYVSITSDKNDFTNTSENNMRINAKNVYGDWVNMFAAEVDEEILSKVYSVACS